jgi:hypothetical protein
MDQTIGKLTLAAATRCLMARCEKVMCNRHQTLASHSHETIKTTGKAGEPQDYR